MVRTVFTKIGAAGLLIVAFAPVTASANTLNMQIRPSVQANTTFHVEVKPRLYQDVVLTDSCVHHQKHHDHGGAAFHKRCPLD